LGIKILQGQGLVSGFKIVKTKAHEQGREHQAIKSGKQSGESHTQPHDNYGKG